MVDFSTLLNGNLLYAERPLSEIGNMVSRSYVPVLEMILANPGFKATINMTGFSLELLASEHPDIYGGIPVERLEAFLAHVEKNPDINFMPPSDHLGSPAAGLDTVYLKSGSWSTNKDFKLWADDPDNQSLNRTALEACQAFAEGRDRLGEKERREVLRDLLLSFNSDGRGWVPIPEHRLFCFDRALEVMGRMAGPTRAEES